jgi:hypothetical protein
MAVVKVERTSQERLHRLYSNMPIFGCTGTRPLWVLFLSLSGSAWDVIQFAASWSSCSDGMDSTSIVSRVSTTTTSRACS